MAPKFYHWRVTTVTRLSFIGIHLKPFTFTEEFHSPKNYIDAFTEVALKYRKSNRFFSVFIHKIEPVLETQEGLYLYDNPEVQSAEFKDQPEHNIGDADPFKDNIA